MNTESKESSLFDYSSAFKYDSVSQNNYKSAFKYENRQLNQYDAELVLQCRGMFAYSVHVLLLICIKALLIYTHTYICVYDCVCLRKPFPQRA